MHTETDLHSRINTRLNDLLFQNTPLTQFVVLVNSLIVYLILYQYLQGTAVGLWLLVITQIAVFRLILSRLYWRRRKRNGNTARLLQLFFILTWLSAVIWGLLIFIVDGQELWMESFVAFVIAGMSAGSLISNASRRLASVPYLVLVLAPLPYHFATLGNPQHLAMAVMVALYLVLMVRLSYRIHDMQYHAYRSELENEDMYRILKRAKRDTEDTRSRLETEREKLPDEMAMLDVFFDIAHERLAIINSKGRFVQANTSFLEATGLEQDEYHKHNIYDYIHEDDMSLLRHNLDQLKKDRDVEHCRLRLRTAGGGFQPLDLNLLSYHDLYYLSGRDAPPEP